MSDSYKLVFRGEVLDGQHPAVVRKRLGESAGFGADALDKLFSGRPVVVKREADTATAAKFQAVFKKAGARLRVLPVDTGDEEVSAAAPAADAGFELLPAGSDLLAAGERREFEPRDVDTSSLRLEGARFAVDEPEPEVPAPDVSHLSVAAAGSDLGTGSGSATPLPVRVPDFDLAETGADLGSGPRDVAPAVDFGALTFEVAPAGADLGQARRLAPPEPPDVSHLSLAPAQDD